VFQANQPNTEVFINAALTWAFALVVGAGPAAAAGRWWGIGALLALGSLYKHVVVVVAALLAAAHLALPPRGATRRRALGQAGIVSLIAAAAWAVVAGYFAATGRWVDFRDAVFTYNRTYAAPLSTTLAAAFGALAILLGAILPQYRLPPEEWTRQKYQQEGEYFLASAPLAREIDGLLAADETFYEWGAETGLYFVSGRRPPTGLTSMYPLL